MSSADDALRQLEARIRKPERTKLSDERESAPETRGRDRLNLRDLREVRFERVTWFEENVIPRDELTLVNGDGGIGKTTAVLDLVARSSSKRPMPSGLRHDPPLRWLIVAEEDRHGLLRARLDVAGADHDNLRLVESVGEDQAFLTFPAHARALHDAILEGAFDGVFIDALLNHLDDEVNSSRPQEMRRALRPLIEVAHNAPATIIAIRHLTKGTGPASSRGLGSVEARNLSRSELTVAPHPDEDTHPGLFVMALSKANLSPDRTATLAYLLTSVEVTDDDGLPTTVARVDWESAPPAISADDLLDRQEPAERGRLEAAADWLRGAFPSGERRATEVCEEAAKAGHAMATIYRARRPAGVVSVRRGFPAQAYWFLRGGQDSHVSQYGEFEKTEKPGSNPADDLVRAKESHSRQGFMGGTNGADADFGINERAAPAENDPALAAFESHANGLAATGKAATSRRFSDYGLCADCRRLGYLRRNDRRCRTCAAEGRHD